MAEILIPLKTKYRPGNARNITGRTKGIVDPACGTWVWNAEKWRPNPGAPGNGRTGQFGAYTLGNGKKNKKRGRIRPRRHCYGPFWRVAS